MSDNNVVQMPPRDQNTAAADVSAVALIKDAKALKEALPGDFDELVKRVTALSDGVERLVTALPKKVDPKTKQPAPVIGDEAMALRMTDFLAQLSGCGREIEKKREGAKKPYLDGCKVVDKWFKELSTTIQAAATRVKAIYDPWLNARADALRTAELAKAEAARAEAASLSEKATTEAEIERVIELERAAQDADAKADNSASIAGRVTGELGSIGYLRTDLKVTITDLDAVPADFKSDARVIEAIKAALVPVIEEAIDSGDARKRFGDENNIPGVSVERKRASVVRKA